MIEDIYVRLKKYLRSKEYFVWKKPKKERRLTDKNLIWFYPELNKYRK